MPSEDNNFVLHGPKPTLPLPNVNATLGTYIYENLVINQTDDEAMVDIFTGKSISYKTIVKKSRYLAEALRIYGYTDGTVLSICSENNVEFYIPVLASLYLGNIIAPINHNYTMRELEFALNISKPKVVFCSEEVSSSIKNIKRKVNYIEKIVIIDSNKPVPEADNLQDFIKNAIGDRVFTNKFQTLVKDSSKIPAFILYSSGTTGLPKGVLLSQRNFLVRIWQSKDPQLSFPKDDIALGLLPFSHSYGLYMGIAALLNKNKLVIMKRFDEDTFLKCIQDYKISVLAIVPPLAVFLVKNPKVLQYDLSCVKEIFCGAAPLNKNIEMELGKRFKKIKSIRQGYGLTETTLSITQMERNVVRPGSCGKTMTFTMNKIRDPESGKSLGANQVGEICTKGPKVMVGYYNDSKATEESFTSDGWFKTGDLGYYDKEGYFYIVGRLKELIKYKGFQVAPAELESVLLTHPKVLDAGVVGVPDESAGELPLAFVVKYDGVNVSEKELQEYVADRVSPQKRLRGGVVFVPNIPKSTSGKILRKELRKLLKNYRRLQSNL